MRSCVRACLPIVMMAWALAVPPAANAQLFGVSRSQELDAGRQADAQIRQKYRISNDAYQNGLVQHLGRRLTRVSEMPDIAWTFRVVDSRDINAFSVPGYVYVNSGLLSAVGSDQDMLAGVIAHEIGHTTGHHAMKQAQQSSVIDLLGGLVGGRNRTLGALAGVFGNVVELGHSRGDENDADKRAVRYTIRAGYDPEGLVRFFRMLQSRQGRESGGVATYFRTHPLTSERITRVQKEIDREQGNRSSFSDRRDSTYGSPDDGGPRSSYDRGRGDDRGRTDDTYR